MVRGRSVLTKPPGAVELGARTRAVVVVIARSSRAQPVQRCGRTGRPYDLPSRGVWVGADFTEVHGQ